MTVLFKTLYFTEGETEARGRGRCHCSQPRSCHILQLGCEPRQLGSKGGVGAAAPRTLGKQLEDMLSAAETLRMQETAGVWSTLVVACWCLSSWEGWCPACLPHTRTPDPSARPAAHSHQRRDGFVSHVVAGGCVVLNHLPVLCVQPPANAVDLPGGQGMWGTAGGLWGQQDVHAHENVG